MADSRWVECPDCLPEGGPGDPECLTCWGAGKIPAAFVTAPAHPDTPAQVSESARTLSGTADA